VFGSTVLVVSSGIPILGFGCTAAPEYGPGTGGYSFLMVPIPLRSQWVEKPCDRSNRDHGVRLSMRLLLVL
jgi:hypothetical protein